uniref:(northern house mosquito) hypothetical protein n=1 Tax=Culex pipiens TaxID=7175 RepID=A0A8D8BQ99_CULPI
MKKTFSCFFSFIANWLRLFLFFFVCLIFIAHTVCFLFLMCSKAKFTVTPPPHPPSLLHQFRLMFSEILVSCFLIFFTFQLHAIFCRLLFSKNIKTETILDNKQTHTRKN